MKFILTWLFMVSVFIVNAQPPSASEVMKTAELKAKATGKNIFVIFHASWCIWCHRMDSAMNEPALKPLFQNNYVIEHLTILEGKEKKHLENPGAEEMFEKYHGKGQGIPFWLVFDKNGKLLSNSRIPKPDGSEGNNAGCPATDEEVGFFVQVLKKTSNLNDAEINTIRERFLKINSH